MNINVNYTSLFSGFGNNNSNSSFGVSGLYSLVGEYNNIRSGAFYKAAKEYFSTKTEDTSSASSTNRKFTSADMAEKLEALKSESKSVTSVYSTVKEEAADLKDAISALTKTDEKSLFVEKEKVVKDEKTGEESTVKEIDKEAIQSAVKDFVSAYNETVEAAYDSEDTAVIRNAGYMTKTTDTFSRALNEVGITVNKDNTLSVDEDKLSTAKLGNLQTLFNGSSSYAAVVSQKADMITTAATNSATSAQLYNNTGAYQYSNLSAGSLDWYL